MIMGRYKFYTLTNHNLIYKKLLIFRYVTTFLLLHRPLPIPISNSAKSIYLGVSFRGPILERWAKKESAHRARGDGYL